VRGHRLLLGVYAWTCSALHGHWVRLTALKLCCIVCFLRWQVYSSLEFVGRQQRLASAVFNAMCSTQQLVQHSSVFNRTRSKQYCAQLIVLSICHRDFERGPRRGGRESSAERRARIASWNAERDTGPPGGAPNGSLPGPPSASYNGGAAPSYGGSSQFPGPPQQRY